MKKIAILGCRGIPAKHGGFETFAEKLAPFLVANGWDVSVYCQTEINSEITYSKWNDVTLINIPASRAGPIGTIIFDFKSVLHAASNDSKLILTLGYNTAIFCVLYKLKKYRNVINMDGIEWHRGKWSYPVRLWFYLNEKFACLISNHLIADHPEIKNHLIKQRARPEKISMISYGADEISNADSVNLKKFNLLPNEYALIVGRPQKDNSVLEMVIAFSKCKRNIKLAVLCSYDPDNNDYDKQVIDAASDEVLFLGPVYKKADIHALQYYCKLYLHGHQVGGTNPSLVEALVSGSAIVAHNNKFNRWVADSAALYFSDQHECEQAIDTLLTNELMIKNLKTTSYSRGRNHFHWDGVLSDYNQLLTQEYSKLEK